MTLEEWLKANPTASRIEDNRRSARILCDVDLVDGLHNLDDYVLSPTLDEFVLLIPRTAQTVPEGACFEMMDNGISGNLVASGRIYRRAKNCPIVGKVTAYQQYTKLKVQIHPTNVCRIVRDIEGL